MKLASGNKINNRTLKTSIVIIGYLLLVLIFSPTLITKINTDIAGSDDAFQVLKNALISSTSDQSLTISEVINWLNPKNIGSIYIHLNILDKFFKEPLAYNIFWLLSFFISSISAYLLLNYLLKNRIAAFTGGFIYGFSTIHFIFSLGFGPANHIEWIPFFILFFIKFFDKPNAKNIFFTLFFGLFILKNDLHFTLYTALFILIYSLYYLRKNPVILKNKKFIYYSICALVFFIIASFIFFGSMLKTTFSVNNYLNPGIEQTDWNAADVMSFFTPSSLHVFWGDFFRKVSDRFTGNEAERSVYIGFTVIFLTVIAVINRKKTDDSRHIIFWFLSALFFSIMALGPFLHFMGELNPKIPMPYLFLYHYIPFFQNIRGTGRIFIMASLCFSILSGYGIKILAERYAKKVNLRAVIIGFIFMLAALEVFPTLPTSAVAPPEFYRQLAKEPGDFKIMQPLITTTYPYATMAHYYNSYHNKDFIGKNFSDIFVRPRENALKFEKETPVVNELMHYLPFGEEKMNALFIKQDLGEMGNFILNQNNIKYLIFDKKTINNESGNYIRPENFAYIKKYISKQLDTSIKVDDNDLLVYEINQTDKKPLVLTLGENWLNLSIDSGGFENRWMTNNTELIVTNYSNQAKKARFEIELLSSAKDEENIYKKVEIYLNDEIKGTYLISDTFKKYILYLDQIQPGDNTISFKVYDSSGDYIPNSQNSDEINKTLLARKIEFYEIDNIDIPSFYQKYSPLPKTGLIQIPIHTNYSFEEESFKNKSLGNFNIVEYDYFIDKIQDDYEPEYFIDRTRLYTLLALLSNQINYDQININYDIFKVDYAQKVGQNIMSKYGIGYLAIYKKWLDENTLQNFKSYFEYNIPLLKLYYEDEDLIVYRSYSYYDPNILELKLGMSWGQLLWYRSQPPECEGQCRALKQKAEINIYNNLDKNQSGELKFTVNSANINSVYLKSILNEEPVSYQKINPGKQEIVVELNDLLPGKNTLEFEVLDKNNKFIEDSDLLKVYNLSI